MTLHKNMYFYDYITCIIIVTYYVNISDLGFPPTSHFLGLHLHSLHPRVCRGLGQTLKVIINIYLVKNLYNLSYVAHNNFLLVIQNTEIK